MKAKPKSKARPKAPPAVLQRARQWVFEAPYAGVPWLVFLYIAFAHACFPHGGVFSGQLVGHDDHTRMVQILNWVNGAGFYDRTIKRANPPQGFTTIWSRIVDIPYAAVIIIAEMFMAQKKAALLSAVIIPAVELIILFPVARYFARPLVGHRDSWLVVLFILFTSVTIFFASSVSGFQWGEASHHSWYIILDLLLFGAAGRIAMGVATPRTQFILGLSIALLLAVGIEGFPMIATAIALIGFIGWIFDRPAIVGRAAMGTAYGAALALFLLPMHQPPEHWFDPSFAEPSILGPILIAAASAFLGLEKIILKRVGIKKIPKLILIAIAGAAIAALLVGFFPKILAGPAAGLTSQERLFARINHPEAQPLYEAIGDQPLKLAGLIVPTIISLIAGITAVLRARSVRRRSVAIAYLGFAGFSGGMAEWLMRYYHHALTTSCAWLLWTWRRLAERLPRNKFSTLASLAIFVVIGPLGMLILPAIQEEVPFLPYVLVFPAHEQATHHPCDPVAFGDYLDAHYSKNIDIIAPDGETTRLLYHSDLTIDYLSQFPSHNKFIDNELFFYARQPDVARDIARRHRIDLIAVCPYPFIAAKPPLEKGKLIMRLITNTPPAWIKQVPNGAVGGYMLFSVDKSRLAEP